VVLTRREFLRSATVVSVGALAGAAAYGVAYERHQIDLVTRAVAVRGLPPALDGLRVGMITDVHHSSVVPADDIAHAVSRLKDAAPDIVVLGGDLVRVVKEATNTIPVVMLTSYDPVESKVINSFARPGGNMTGVAYVGAETGAKRLQYLKEAAPSLTRVAVLWDPGHPDGEFRDMQRVASQLGVQLQSLEAARPEDFEAAFQAVTRERAQALMVVSSRLMNINRPRILEFAAKQRIPLVSGWGPWVRSGGFMSYGPDLDVLVRRAASHVDKILKGARPGEIPVEQPSKFELLINLKTARALGLTVPPSLLARADHVIE